MVLFNYNVEENCWQLKGKARSHYETINDIRFFCTKDSSVLHTIGADRYLVEYNNHQAKLEDFVIISQNLFIFIGCRSDSNVEFGISTRDRIEQSAVPCNFTYYEKNINGHNVGYILIANDKVRSTFIKRVSLLINFQHKIKTVHASSKIPRTLVLGPAFGCFKDSHIKKMRVNILGLGRWGLINFSHFPAALGFTATPSFHGFHNGKAYWNLYFTPRWQPL